MTEKTPSAPEFEAVRAVAANPARAEELARLLAEAGCPGAATTDLEGALAAGPRLVLADPEGWGDGGRRALESYDARPTVPPVILLTGADPSAFGGAGSAFALLPGPLAPRRLVAEIGRGGRLRERFRSYWPGGVRVRPGADADRVAGILARTTGIEIRADREAAFLTAVRHRMVARFLPTLRQYAAHVDAGARGAAEVEALAALLSVGETYFWRHAGQFRALGDLLLPEFLRSGRGMKAPFRVWSVGCSSGEEVYSIAMACAEGLGSPSRVEVVGTDIHPPSLARAREGVYRERALRNLPTGLRAKYLEPGEGGERVRAALRDAVRFEHLNLGSDTLEEWAATRGPFDAVFCRNLLIYLTRPACARAVDAFGTALAVGGGLFLGSAEAMLGQRPGFEAVRAAGTFFYRRVKEPVAAPGSRDGPGAPAGIGLEARLAALWGQGLSHLDQEDGAGARACFEELGELSPQDARGHAGMALLLANEGRETEAAGPLERALAGRPALPEARYLAGLLAERGGHETAALASYRDALALDPGFFMAHVNRAWILQRLGRPAAFRAEMEAAMAILRTGPRVAPWLTGGMGWEALLDFVAEAAGEEGGGR